MAAQIDQAILFGSAPCENWTFLTAYLQQGCRTVLCADGGVHSARAAGLQPDYLVGDWDSGGVPEEGARCITLPVEKDMTDLQAAMDLALTLGIRELLLCGCTGGRLDHTASNLVLLEWFQARGGHGIIVDPENEVHLLDCGHTLVKNDPCFRYLSLVPLDRQVEGVFLQGVKYPLTDATLIRGDTRSISNEPLGVQASITIGSGRALLIRSERLTIKI